MSALPKQPTYPDPLLDEIHKVKQAVSERAGHDVLRLCRELREEQERSGAQVVRRQRRDPGSGNVHRHA